MTVRIIRGDAAQLDLPDDSVDLVITSPPYWALRSYQDGGEHYQNQIGAEPTPAAYVDSLIRCTREWVRVLKPTGSIWVNLGDKYAGSTNPNTKGRQMNGQRRPKPESTGAPHKSLIGLPWRYAIRCIDDLGLILRAEVIWSKPNGLPESVRDRVRRSHETWFHLVKTPRYFAGVDAIREPTQNRPGLTWDERKGRNDTRARYSTQNGHGGSGGMADNPLGKLPGSVWTIATQPLKVPAELCVDHFAAFPMEWPRRIILGWSPSGICTACAEGRRAVVERGESSWKRRRADGDPIRYGLVGSAGVQRSLSDAADRAAGGLGVPAERRITGEACACPDASAPTRPAVVLDPFGGTGTTALVADVLGRDGLSVDMSADYCRLAEWRTQDPKQRERAARPAKARNDPPRAATPRLPKQTPRNEGPGWETPALFETVVEGHGRTLEDRSGQSW